METLVERDRESFVMPAMDLEPPFVAIRIDTRPTELEVLTEVHRIVSLGMEAAESYGSLPSMRSDEWMDAPIEVKIATILNLGQGYLLANPERQALEMVRDVSYAFSTSHDWTNSISHAELVRRRSEPGPTTALCSDPSEEQTE